MISKPVASGRPEGWDGILSAYADCLMRVQGQLTDDDMQRFLEVGARVFRSCCQEDARQRWTAEQLAAYHRKPRVGD